MKQNKIFWSSVQQRALKTSGNLKYASLMSSLGFFIVTAIAGIIFYIMGYFGLGNDLKGLKHL